MQDSSRTQNAQVGLSSFGFVNGDLPYSNGAMNHAAEPQIAADKDGNLYVSSERGLFGGTDMWKSVDGGLAWTYLGEPDEVFPGFSNAGGDTSLAVATAQNQNGMYNVYMSSLSLWDVDVSTSMDGGNTWSTNYGAASVPFDDRPWIAAYGANTVYLSYHDTSSSNINVDRSDDAGVTFANVGEAINPASNPGVAGATNNNQIGNLAVDPNTGTVYQIFVAGNGLKENNASAPMHVVYMAVSTDGGSTFTDVTVHNGPANVSYDHQFPQVSLDQAGNVYAVFSDDHNVYYCYSTDAGQSWSQAMKINSNPSVTSIEPWSVGGAEGRLGVVWYGTAGTVASGTGSAANRWFVYYAHIDQANTQQPVITQVRATPIVHRGGVCEQGIACGPNDNRDLYDDFGIAVNPVTGYVSIAYSDDQPSNSTSHTRTRFATQTSGPKLIG